MNTILVFTLAQLWLICSISNAQRFVPLSYEELNTQVKEICDKDPLRCKLTIAQDEFGLPSPGLCGQNSQPCVTQILHITNFSTYDQNKATRPEVYISGELHGDERVGPHAAVEYARLLVQSSNPWIRRLVDTRSIFITPITNSLGYDRNTREEGRVDTNRDYPIDQDASMCMRAIASRIANELYRSHMFQVAITFHGGMEAIAMEWGTRNRYAPSLHRSPDDYALMEIAGGLSDYAGPVTRYGRKYPYGRMNDLVYPVEGGMEDWAYAGSWDQDSRRIPCNPSSFGGYDASKTKYTDSMLRTVNVLVETSNSKWPSDFGTPNDILDANSGTGHVPRNVRLALMLTDLVEPYIQWTSASIVDDRIILNWEVGGAFQVDSTWATLRLGNAKAGEVLMQSPTMSGKTRWSTTTYADREKFPFKTQFSACFKIPTLSNVSQPILSTELIVEARAKVDSAWAMTGKQNTVSPKGLPPQTHLVNARTNPDWDKSNNGFQVKGKLEWVSDKLTVKLNVKKRRLRAQSKDILVPTMDETEDDANPECVDEVLKEWDSVSNKITTQGFENGKDMKSNVITNVSYGFAFTILAFLLFCVLAVYMYRTRNRATHQPLPVTPDELE